MLFLASQALAKPGDNTNSTPVSSAATKHCNNVYNSFYAGPNKKIETILQEMKTQLTQLQDDIDVLKGKTTTVKGKFCFFFLLNLKFCLFSKTFGIYGTHKYFIRCPSTTIWNPLFLAHALFLFFVHGLLNWNS